MKKKTLLLALAMLACVCMLFSCALFGGDTGDGTDGGTDDQGGTDNTDQNGDGEVLGTYTQIVVKSLELDIFNVRTAVMGLLGPINTVEDSQPAAAREIVIGDTNRSVTAEAKAQLAADIAADDNADIGYIIYSDGKSVAIYWSNEDMAQIAMTMFVNTCINEDQLVLESGTLNLTVFNEDEYELEGQWLALESICDPDTYVALRKLSSYYNGDRIAGWMANLWDDEIGGFYYSISARDNEPFLPDIESTNQALGWLTNNNLIKSQNDDIPNDIKIKIVDFAKSLQSEKDGYFYHPQWPQGRENLNVDRVGRDLSWAAGIINRFTVDRDGDGVEEKQYPNFCSPEGTRCEEHANGGSCSFVTATVNLHSAIGSAVAGSNAALTVSVCEGVSAAVARAYSSVPVPTASTSSSRPDYSSESAFKDWLYATNDSMGTTSGNAQMINALQDEIIANGYCGVLLDFLDEMQQQIYDEQVAEGETPTGLWQKPIDYHAVWGLLKYTPFYNHEKYGRELKYAEEIVDACIDVIMLPAEDSYSYRANDIYNQWQGMQALFNNVKKYDPENLENLYKMVREGGADLINNTIAKLAPFKRDDGAFSFYTTGSSASLYGTTVSQGLMESDVNATVLLCSMYRCMFTCYGYSVIHLCDSSDGEEFIQMLREVEPIDKKPQEKPTTIDFEDGDQLTSVTFDNQSGGAQMVITDDNGLYFGNQVLKFNTMPANASTYGDGLLFQVKGLPNANCLIFESDICVARNDANNDILQIRLDNFYRILIRRNGNSLSLIEMVETAGAVSPKTLTSSLKLGEWFKLRIECYRPDDSYDTPRFKIFINDEYVTTTGTAYTVNGTPSYGCSTVLFRSLRAAQSEILLDNCFFYGQVKDYDPDDHNISDDR